MKRRNFLKNGLIAGTALAALPSWTTLPSLNSKIRVGVIGVGMRGRGLMGLLLDRPDVEVVAVSDVAQDSIDLTKKIFIERKLEEPTYFLGNEDKWKELVAMNNIDAIVIATPWRFHAPMAMAAMESGKYAGVEVPAALTVDDCFKLVETSERTGMPCMMLENVCYRRDIMAVLSMVRKGMFGELVHMEGGYQHDLRHVKFNDGKGPYDEGLEFGVTGYSEAKWRTGHALKRNGDFYPTHGIGPIAQMLNINKGNKFLSISSFASKSRGLDAYVEKVGGKEHPHTDLDWKQGDVTTSVLTTSNGETITLQHDTNLPRPYSLGFRVQGTKGLWMDLNKSLHIEGLSPEHRWEDAKAYLDKNDHPLWRNWEKNAAGAGHGGMDFFVLHGFIEACKRKIQTPIDVYDSAAWSAIVELSEQSVTQGGAPIPFPDFTGGEWVYRKNTFATNGEF
ncbi:MAG: putative dehydrogenase [Litorivivens sp.]|jgi:predicted dehydrogenase